MELATAQRLADLNRAFYVEHAENFADSRPRLAPGIQRALAHLPPQARVLELGCGDGKVGRWLAAQASPAFYLGLDSSEAMLARARQFSEQKAESSRQSLAFRLLPSAYRLADFTAPNWTRVLPANSFDWILAFALFHHLPGYEMRAGLLRTLADRLAEGGSLVMSNWQFTRSERLRQRIAPWTEIGLQVTDVEANDYLLTWERKGKRGLRYVHLLDEAEARRMAEAAGLTVIEVFRSDGAAGDLADYALMRKSE